MRFAVALTALLASVLLPMPSAAAEGATTVCRFDDDRFDEISGMTYSQRHEGVIYLHNDSSGGPLVYAVDASTCRTLATLTVAGIEARDLEAIASGRDRKGRPILWLADIGDNLDSWSEVRLHRVREPAVLRDRTVTARTYRFTYADRPHDAEALLADPDSLRVWVVTKQDARGRLYALPSRMSRSTVNVATPVRKETGMVTDGSVSPDGSRYALRDYVDAEVFAGLPPGRDPQTVYLPLQLQGEAMTWTPDGSALLVAGERDSRLQRVPVPAAASVVAPAATSSPSSSGGLWTPAAVSERPQPATQQAGEGGNAAVLAIGLVGLAAAVIAIAEWRRRRAPGEPPG